MSKDGHMPEGTEECGTHGPYHGSGGCPECPPPEACYDHGPPGPPLRIMLLGVGLLILVAMLYRCH